MSIGGFPQDRRGKNAGKCKCVPWFLFVSLAEQCLQPRHSSGRAGNSSVPHPRHWSPCQTLEDTVIARTDHKVKAGTHRRGSRDHQTITALQARPPIQRRTADDSDEITKDETRDEMMTSSFWGSVDKPTAGSSKRHPRVGPKPLPVDVAHALLMQPLLFTQTRNPMQHRPQALPCYPQALCAACLCGYPGPPDKGMSDNYRWANWRKVSLSPQRETPCPTRLVIVARRLSLARLSYSQLATQQAPWEQ